MGMGLECCALLLVSTDGIFGEKAERVMVRSERGGKKGGDGGCDGGL